MKIAATSGRSDPIPVFVNEHAGGRTDAAAWIAEGLEGAGAVFELRRVRPESLATEVKRAADGGARIVGVSGGDGTLHTAAGVLAGSETTLAPIPFGTLNHFSRRLGLGEAKDALRALVAGRSVRVPIGIVDDRVFLNTAIFGAYAEVVRRRDRWKRWLTKWGAAAVASAVTLSGIDRLDIVIDAEGARLRRTTTLVWIGNGRGSFPFSHLAEVDGTDPVLEVVIVRSTHGLGATRVLARLLWRLLRGKAPHHDPGLEVFHTRSLLLRAPGSGDMTLDGEPGRWDSPVFVTVQRNGLRVAAPNPDADGEAHDPLEDEARSG